MVSLCSVYFIEDRIHHVDPPAAEYFLFDIQSSIFNSGLSGLGSDTQMGDNRIGSVFGHGFSFIEDKRIAR
jgi:hypothetical protein